MAFEKSWNKTYLPFPFSKVTIRYSGPIEIPRKISDEELEPYCEKIRAELNRLSEI